MKAGVIVVCGKTLGTIPWTGPRMKEGMMTEKCLCDECTYREYCNWAKNKPRACQEFKEKE
jgi:hypothetical protein